LELYGALEVISSNYFLLLITNSRGHSMRNAILISSEDNLDEKQSSLQKMIGNVALGRS